MLIVDWMGVGDKEGEREWYCNRWKVRFGWLIVLINCWVFSGLGWNWLVCGDWVIVDCCWLKSMTELLKGIVKGWVVWIRRKGWKCERVVILITVQVWWCGWLIWVRKRCGWIGMVWCWRSGYVAEGEIEGFWWVGVRLFVGGWIWLDEMKCCGCMSVCMGWLNGCKSLLLDIAMAGFSSHHHHHRQAQVRNQTHLHHHHRPHQTRPNLMNKC